MKEAIERFNPGAEFYTKEGCHIIELSNTPDDPDTSIAKVRVAPGVTTRWHRLDGTTERYVILEGRGRMEVGGLPAQDIGAFDIVRIPLPPTDHQYRRSRPGLPRHLYPPVHPGSIRGHRQRAAGIRPIGE